MNDDPIASLMQRNVTTVDMDDCAADVEGLFEAKNLSWAPVVDDGGVPVGVISAVDLLRTRLEGRDPTDVRAWQLCSYRPVTVTASTPVPEVARRMLEKRIHHVVVTGEGGIAGVVSALDFVGWAARM